MSNYIYIAQSLDGYIADQYGEVDWLNDIPNPEGSDFGFTDFLSSIDAIVMGRNTFQTVQQIGVWPYTKTVFVISSTITSLPKEYRGKAVILDLAPSEIIEYLYNKGMNNLYIDGGSLIQSFLDEDLIDEMIITTVPILLGRGIPLFGKLKKPKNFMLVSSEIMLGSLVKNHYQKTK